MKQILISTDTAVGSATNPANVAAGAIAIFREDNTLLSPGDTIADSEKIYFVRGVASGETPEISAGIQGSGVKIWKGLSYVAPVKQVAHVGFQGTGTNTISVTNGGKYTFGVTSLDANWEPYPRKSVQIVADSSATPFEIATAIAKEANANYLKANPNVNDPKNFPVYVEVLADITTGSAGAGGGTVAVERGSKLVVFTNSPSVVAGSFVRFGTNNDTSPVYVVASVSGLNVYLTREYVGATDAALAIASVNFTNTAPVVGDEAGLEITAKDFGSIFTIFLDEDFEGTVITYTTPYNPGSGTSTQVAKIENDNRGWKGELNRTILPLTQPTYTVSGATYDLYHVQFANETLDRAFPVQMINNVQELVIAIPAGAASQAAFENALNPWMASTPKAFPSVNL